MNTEEITSERVELEIKNTKLRISELQVFLAEERLMDAIKKHKKLSGHPYEVKIMSDLELSIFQARRVANPDLLIDPVIVDRLMATAIHYRNAIDIASEYLPGKLIGGRMVS